TEPPRPAEADEPVEQRGAVGDALAPVLTQPRVLVAGRPHLSRVGARSDRGGGPHPRLLPLHCGGLARGSRAERPEASRRAVPWCRPHPDRRGAYARSPGAADGDVALLRPELRPRLA